MKVSVIIPAYNCADYLTGIIDSIYHSGLKIFEIIIVNDGSTDGTAIVLDQLMRKRRELRVIQQENKGVSAARNRGIRESRGDYIFFIDADDALDPGGLTEANEVLETEKPDMLLFGMHFDYYHNASLYRSDEAVYPKHGTMNAEAIVAEYEALFQNNMLSPVWNKLIRRELIISNGISFREDMIEMEDYLFSVRCLAHCSHIYILDRAVYRYRQPERERGTFNRLWRIDSLSKYMAPFYEAAQWFESEPGAREQVCRVADRIYSGLFHEQIRFANKEQIRIAAEDMLSGAYSRVIAHSDPKLYEELKKKQYASVWGRRILKRARHWAAVQVKYRRSLRK